MTFFQKLFNADSLVNVNHLQVPIVPNLNQEGVEALNAPVTMEEICTVVFSMKSYKALGPDGFHPLFFKNFLELVRDDLWRFVNLAFQLGYSDPCIAEILIVLIPKVDHPTRFKELRPISLCNVIYKVITKVVVQRIRPFLDHIIGPL